MAVAGEDGFTFIEFLVVVIIIGILAAIAIPVYLGMQKQVHHQQNKTCIVNVTTNTCR